VLRHIASIIVLPVMVTVVVPLWLLSGDVSLGWTDQRMVRAVMFTAGVASFVLGLTLFVATLRDFARLGRGTLAPWDPPRVLVVEGVYRYVRNPMISGVLLILMSEVLLIGSPRLLGWLVFFFLVNLLYIPLIEEPALANRFGERYRIYQYHVPRWVPRRSPWIPPWQAHNSSRQQSTSRPTRGQT
jgi:protein-S-isoprenylcysteine O-methyltransferase Ste14